MMVTKSIIGGDKRQGWLHVSECTLKILPGTILVLSLKSSIYSYTDNLVRTIEKLRKKKQDRRQTGRQTDRQADRWTHRQTDRQTGRETDRQTDRSTDRKFELLTQTNFSSQHLDQKN